MSSKSKDTVSLGFLMGDVWVLLYALLGGVIVVSWSWLASLRGLVSGVTMGLDSGGVELVMVKAVLATILVTILSLPLLSCILNSAAAGDTSEGEMMTWPEFSPEHINST